MSKPNAITEIDGLVEDYLDACKANGVKASTIKGTYGYSLRDVFLPFCRAKGVRHLAEVDNRFMTKFANELKDRPAKNKDKPLSEHTVHTYRRALNQFLKWVREDGRVAVPLTKNPKLGRLPKNGITVLERDDIDRIERVADSQRDKLIVRVLADTGVRVSELTGLTIDDIIDRGGNDYLRIRHGKGDKDRLVPLYEPLLGRINEYAHRDRKVDEEAKHIFTSEKRIPGKGFEPLTKSGVQQLIRKLGEDAGIKRVYPHLFRHSFITWLIIRRVAPNQIAEIVGHENTRMIDEVYAHLVPANAYDAMADLFKTKKGSRS